MSEIITSTMSLKDSGGDSYYTKLTSADIGADKNFTLTSPVLQVVQTIKTDTSSIALSSGAVSSAVSGLTVAITPSSANSKVLITGFVTVAMSSDDLVVHIALSKGGSVISGSVAANPSNRFAGHSAGFVKYDGYVMTSIPFNFLDSPSTTSATTYGVLLHNSSSSSRTIYVNISQTDTDSSTNARLTSVITAMEVGG